MTEWKMGGRDADDDDESRKKGGRGARWQRATSLVRRIARVNHQERVPSIPDDQHESVS